MGDCRIRISISRLLLSSLSEEATEQTEQISIVRTFIADTTVREVCESTPELWTLYTGDSNSGSSLPFKLWDCTYHPPNDITDWPIQVFPDVTGSKSKTLHAAGWFPSGTLVALPPGVAPSRAPAALHEDSQYNIQQDLLGRTDQPQEGSVHFIDSSLASSRPQPSAVLASVTRRFDNEDNEMQAETDMARAARIENRMSQSRKQRERDEKLDRRIELLEENSTAKNKKVSDQVRRMLVKSRAKGDKRLKQQDRIYFQCILDKGSDHDLSREFRFFSPQDTFARICASFDAPPKDSGLVNVEVLVKQGIYQPVGKAGEPLLEYRQFPLIMRIYEAMSEKHLTGDVDTLVIRWYSADDSASLGILANEGNTTTDTGLAMEKEMEILPEKTDAVMELTEQDDGNAQAPTIVDERLTLAVQAMDKLNTKGKKPKKESAAATKVRQLQIKSKAKGDAKRVPNMESRFFLEVVLVDQEKSKATSGYYFLAKTDPLDRVLQSMNIATKGDDWLFLVPSADANITSPSYMKISDPSITIVDLEAQGMLKMFDRMILCPK